MHAEREKNTAYCHNLEKDLQLLQFKLTQAQKDLEDKSKEIKNCQIESSK